MRLWPALTPLFIASCGGSAYQCVNDNGITVASIEPENVVGIPGESLAQACAAIIVRGEPATAETMYFWSTVSHAFSENPVPFVVAGGLAFTVMALLGLAGG